MRGSDEHRWEWADDVVAFYLSRHGDERLSLKEETIAERLGMSLSALRMRQANFRFLDTGAGLSHPSNQSRLVFERFKEWDEPRLRGEVGKHL
jgi:hypothetical protein